MGQDAAAQGEPAAGGAPGGGQEPWGEERIRAAFTAAGGDSLVNRMGIRLVEASAQRVVATMPVAGNTQPAGLLHGGASCVLAETLGSVGAALHAGPGRTPVGTEINATHHRGAAGGDVTAVATLLHGGRTTASYEIVITDDRGRRVCTARLSCLLLDIRPGYEQGVPPAAATQGDGQVAGS